MFTNSLDITVGTGEGPRDLVEGPIVITAISSNCPLTLKVRTPESPQGVAVDLIFTRLFIPEGGVLTFQAALGFCKGTLVYGGFRP